MSVTGRRDVTEDLTAEAFLEVHRHADAIALDLGAEILPVRYARGGTWRRPARP
jgi:hypothetical protein